MASRSSVLTIISVGKCGHRQGHLLVLPSVCSLYPCFCLAIPIFVPKQKRDPSGKSKESSQGHQVVQSWSKADQGVDSKEDTLKCVPLFGRETLRSLWYSVLKLR